MDRLGTSITPGVMFWASPASTPEETLAPLLALGFRDGQLGIPGDLPLAGLASLWQRAAHDAGFTIHTVFTAYSGESYRDIATVQSTVGFVPVHSRSAREARTHAVVDFAQELALPGIATHIGFIPENCSDPEYQAVLEIVRRVADHAFPLTFALETGQETAPALLAFLEAAARPNLGINFDPANLILYGTGEPLPALALLAPYVLSVHLKDGNWPQEPGALGQETPLGQGAVPLPQFLRQLREIGYNKPVFIEREIERESVNPASRLQDLAFAMQLLRNQEG